VNRLRPRLTGKDFFEGFVGRERAEGWRRNSLLMAALMEQPSAMETLRASRYKSSSRFTVSLTREQWCDGAVVSTPAASVIHPFTVWMESDTVGQA
jgi:hypothetical protein